MTVALPAFWIKTGLLLLCTVFPTTIAFGPSVQWSQLYHNDVQQTFKRTLTADDRAEIQRALDVAIVKDYIERQWQMHINDGEITQSVQRTGGERGNHFRFETAGDLRLKDVFHLMQFYPLLFGDETSPTYFDVPIGADYQRFRLENRPRGKFSISAKHGEGQYVDLSDLSTQVTALGDSNTELPLRTTLQQDTITALDATLASQPNFEQTLTRNDPQNTVSSQEREEAFQAAKDVLAGSSVLGTDISTLNPASWLTDVKTNIDQRRMSVALQSTVNVEREKNTKLRFEFTQSILQSAEQAKNEWERLKGITIDLANGQQQSIIEERTVQTERNSYKVVTIHENDEVSLKEVFKLLQFYNDIYDQRPRQTYFEIPIGGETRRFRLSRSIRGRHQILVTSENGDWTNTMRRASSAPDYNTIINRYLANADQNELAEAMQKSLDKKLNDQPSFETDLTVNGQASPDTVRAAVEFMLITMIAEAAQPSQKSRAKFLTDLLNKIRTENRFPEARDIPTVANYRGDEKAGRSPAMDQVVRGMLENVNTRRNIDAIFSVAEFPARGTGGTQAGRIFIHMEGNRDVPAYMIRKRAADDHDGELLFKKVARICTDKRRRKRRSVCKLTDRDSVYVDEESIEVTDNMVELDVVDRRDSELRDHVEFPLSSDELATPKLIKEHIEKSRRAGASRTYAKINKGLAVHGLIFSVLGAADYFNKGDYVRGSISLTQAAHTFGGLTGLNEIVSKLGKHVLSSAATSLAKGLNFEEGLGRFSRKVERFMEKGAGKLLGDIPGVGLAFDVYFIEQDIEQLADLDFSDPDDLKVLPLRVIDLALDVSTTALNLVGTFCPEAEVITEPVVIIISIIRMAIDDFYIDIMSEIQKVNWNSPWAGLQFLGALVKGILDGVADFLTGGLRRQLESYQRQEDNDKQLLRNLTNPDNYFRIVGEREGEEERIDFTQGALSSFGGYITFRLHDNNLATVEIGDVSGARDPIRRTFQVDSNLKDIVLGIGESRDFTYKHETAKLWFVIPIKSFDVICGANLHENSAYGTYYGNSDNNTFYAVQRPKPTTKPPGREDQECNFGKLDVMMLTGNYHYNLYGRGGSDTFYLGPELSSITGGGGSDVYIIQSDGGKAIIDNFAEDDKRDIVVINVDYANIQCHKTGNDVDITYSRSHHIRIKNWFTQGDATYYRHVSFRSKDGVIFVAEQTSSSASNPQINCVAVAVDFSGAKNFQTVSLSDRVYAKVKQVSGSNSSDSIVGNDLGNVMDGGRGADVLTGGKGEDTYVIRATEGCDTINNNAEDFANTTDIVIFAVPLDRISIQVSGNDLSVTDRSNPSTSCFRITNWARGYQYRHMLFTSSDHVVFNVTTHITPTPSRVPIMLDYSTSSTGVNVDLSDRPRHAASIHPPGSANVATVSDSPHNDQIIGNKQTNFLSCSGGDDRLEGGEGSDNYVVKRTCTHAVINNFDTRTKDDVLYLDETFVNLRAGRLSTDFRITSSERTPAVTLEKWFESVNYRHLWIRTRDGITLRVGEETAKLDPTEISKDPTECTCTTAACQVSSVPYDLNTAPWKHLVRFQLNSSLCSYKIYGNELNNYIDPGPGNGYNYQYLEGRNGSDTYVLNHGYGEFNEINNFAVDNKTDALHIGLEFNDIRVYFHGQNDVILESMSRPTSLGIRIQDYFRNASYQHLQVTTIDKITFNISQEVPFKEIISIDRTDLGTPQNINPQNDRILSSAQDLKGSLTSTNYLTGSNTTRIIEGGNMADVLRAGTIGTTFEGKDGDDIIYGGPGIDIIFGGDGDDHIFAGAGDDFIYAGNGRDVIDGGNGSDTISFRGDGFLRNGVKVDLSFGFGKGVDAEEDRYISIENVYGTIHNDTLTGSDFDNSLFGLEGNDTLIPQGGNDKLVGGEGDDLYLLYQAWGIKIIDNYADDEVEDVLSLVHLNSTEVCLFLVENDLHVQVVDLDLTAELFHSQLLTVIIQNWNVNSTYKHLSIVFNNTVWPAGALSDIASIINAMTQSVGFIEEDSRFRVVSASGNNVELSWHQADQDVLPQPNSQLVLVRFPTTNPRNIIETQVNGQTSITVSSLNRNSHYVFALALKKCNATIAVSHTLITYGRRRSCAAVNVPHSTVQYSPTSSGSTVDHGTSANFRCDVGYTITQENDRALTTNCLDRDWIPSLPTCSRIQLCPRLTNPSNGKVSTTGREEGSKALYVCNKGFRLQGPMERTCVHQSWDGSNPSCQALHCPRPPPVDNGELRPCDYMSHTTTFGTINNPLQGYCVKLHCHRHYLPSHRFYGRTHRPRWESDWKIPQGGRVCSDGHWIGYVDDKCDLTLRLTDVTDHWNKKVGILEHWRNTAWERARATPNEWILRLVCESVGLPNSTHRSHYVIRVSEVRVKCSKLRLRQQPTPYEGRLEVVNTNGMWEGVCVPQEGHFLSHLTREICASLGFTGYPTAVVSLPSGQTDHSISCSRHVTGHRQRCTLESKRQECGTKVRCRQKCTDEFPVPGGGETQCTGGSEGQFEGDSCEVICNPRDLRRRGDAIVYCNAGVWRNQARLQGSRPASARCLSVEDLFKADVNRIAKRRGSLSNRALAELLFLHLSTSYPESTWMVNIYNPIGGYDKHTVTGYYYHLFRYYNHNLVVVRYPRHRRGRPVIRLTASLASIVGTENGNHAEHAVDSIARKFGRQSWYCIHAVRKGSGLESVHNIPRVKYLWREFPSLVVTVIAPGVF
ncbi:uncharacterized protein [Montipora foliosa]|uniref:uncharacterized protein n=1 Tax=Montipora foliosa TaxID=591990 RepID=UPI0035F13DD1